MVRITKWLPASSSPIVPRLFSNILTSFGSVAVETRAAKNSASVKWRPFWIIEIKAPLGTIVPSIVELTMLDSDPNVNAVWWNP